MQSFYPSAVSLENSVCKIQANARVCTISSRVYRAKRIQKGRRSLTKFVMVFFCQSWIRHWMTPLSVIWIKAFLATIFSQRSGRLLRRGAGRVFWGLPDDLFRETPRIITTTIGQHLFSMDSVSLIRLTAESHMAFLTTELGVLLVSPVHSIY